MGWIMSSRSAVSYILHEQGGTLSDWEYEFLSSLEDWVGDYTDQQESILERLCDKHGAKDVQLEEDET